MCIKTLFLNALTLFLATIVVGFVYLAFCDPTTLTAIVCVVNPASANNATCNR